MNGTSERNVTRQVFSDPIIQLAAICPICALSALSPEAALSALSPVLRLFNPAINPAAALLAFAMSAPQERLASKAVGRVSSRLSGVALKVQMLRNHRR